jgi:hypothetical protein
LPEISFQSSSKFYDHSALKAKDGTLYFGGAHGFNYFDPNKIIYNNSKNKPVLTAFRIFNSLIKEEEKYNGKQENVIP